MRGGDSHAGCSRNTPQCRFRKDRERGRRMPQDLYNEQHEAKPIPGPPAYRRTAHDGLMLLMIRCPDMK